MRDLALLAATSACVYVAGMIANDVADRRIDATIHPDRPLPSGRISPITAIAVALLAAAGAVALGGGPIGSRLTVGVALLAALLYDAGIKRSLVGGALAMGLVRAANAAVAVVPLVESGGTPAWALAGPALLGLYSAGITVLSTAEGRPHRAPPRLLFARIAAFVAFVGAGVLSVGAADGMTVGAVWAAGIALNVAFARVPKPRPVPAQVFEMLLGFHWLELILASGGFPGRDWVAQCGIFVAAWALVIVANLGVRALRVRAV